MPSKKQAQVAPSKPAPESVIDNSPQPARRTKQTLLLELIRREGGAAMTGQ
jgi:hypothetical protein